MSTAPATHPSDAMLYDFLMGACEDHESLPIEEHLALCPECAGRLGLLDRGKDDFVSRLRSAVAGTPLQQDVTPSPTPLPAPADPLGSFLGPYRLHERLGEGGMGIVYKAEQLRPIKRWVALKVIRPGLDGRRVVARFETERQALALMDHPHIARVLDAGTADDGRPYFVMELVDGAPLTTFCEAHHLDLRERLAIFVQVCEAVQHAHQKGVIHRDLKPSNILLSEAAGTGAADSVTSGATPSTPISERTEPPQYVPKVIDFGIAKATEGRLTNATAATMEGQIVGTLDYMSPEQTDPNAVDIDTRTDVYALGVVLYELLTGTTPLQLMLRQNQALAELLRVVREEEPPRPSRKRQAGGLPPFEELDWIVLKALDKERERRYATAHDLAADVTRFLRDEPVTACPPSTAYLLRKLARRHRRALATAMAFGLLLVTTTAISAWQAIRATQAEIRASKERDEADAARQTAEEAEKAVRREARKATEVNRFFTQDVLPHAAPEFTPVGDKVTLLETLDRAATRISGRFPDQPDVELAVHVAVGDAYLALGSFGRSETHYRAALEAARRGSGERTEDALHARAQLGYALLRLRRLDEAHTLLAPTVAGLIEVAGEDAQSTIQAMNSLAQVHRARKEYTEAEDLFGRAIALAETTWGKEHFTTITIKYNLIENHIERGEGSKIEPELVSLEEAARRVHGETHPTTLGLTNGLAHLYLKRGDFARSEPVFQRLLAGCRHTLGPDHPNTLTVLTRVAEHHHHKKEYDKALKIWEEVLEGRLRTYGPDHPATVVVHEHLAREYLNRNRLDKAEPIWQQLVEVRRRTAGTNQEPLAQAHVILGVIRMNRNRHVEAESCFREGLKIYETFKKGSVEHYNALSQVGWSLAGQKKYAEAEPLLLAGHSGIKAQYASIPPAKRMVLASTRERLTNLYQLWGKPQEASRWRAERDP